MNRPKPARRRERAPPKPLDTQRLTDLAYFHVSRFAVTEGRLRQYLVRKVREKGWADEQQASDIIDVITARLVELGAVNDLAVARSTVTAARQKGLAGHRVRLALATRQVKAEHVAEVLQMSDETDPETEALDAARLFARRKRLGQWRTVPLTPERERKEISAMIRAGHAHTVARRVIRQTDDEG
jgi:regulatory protein